MGNTELHSVTTQNPFDGIKQMQPGEAKVVTILNEDYARSKGLYTDTPGIDVELDFANAVPTLLLRGYPDDLPIIDQYVERGTTVNAAIKCGLQSQVKAGSPMLYVWAIKAMGHHFVAYIDLMNADDAAFVSMLWRGHPMQFVYAYPNTAYTFAPKKPPDSVTHSIYKTVTTLFGIYDVLVKEGVVTEGQPLWDAATFWQHMADFHTRFLTNQAIFEWLEVAKLNKQMI